MSSRPLDKDPFDEEMRSQSYNILTLLTTLCSAHYLRGVFKNKMRNEGMSVVGAELLPLFGLLPVDFSGSPMKMDTLHFFVLSR
jgi:hypothetical protein